jgi:hypothetical protein
LSTGREGMLTTETVLRALSAVRPTPLSPVYRAALRDFVGGSPPQQESQQSNHNNLENMDPFFYDAGTLEINSSVEDGESQDVADHRDDHVDYYEDESDLDD